MNLKLIPTFKIYNTTLGFGKYAQDTISLFHEPSDTNIFPHFEKVYVESEDRVIKYLDISLNKNQIRLEMENDQDKYWRYGYYWIHEWLKNNLYGSKWNMNLVKPLVISMYFEEPSVAMMFRMTYHELVVG